jgi:hypothetical protein
MLIASGRWEKGDAEASGYCSVTRFLRSCGHMTRLVARGLIAFAIVAAGLVALAVVYTLSRPAWTPQMPTPNGFEDFVQGGNRLAGDYSDLKNLSGTALETAVSRDADALRQARRGFSRDCRVPLPPKSADWANHATNLVVLKRLASALVAEGKLAEAQGRTGDAVTAYLDIIRLAHESSRGGIIIHGLVSRTIEAMGENRLEKLVPSLDAVTCRDACEALERIEAKRESAEAVLERERIWVRHAYGLLEQIGILTRIGEVKRMNNNFASRANGQTTRSRQLEVELAVRAYQLEHGDRPKQLVDLVPTYLRSIPQDPITGTNLVYRP